MPRPRNISGNKNIIAEKLIALRRRDGLSQRDLAGRFQLIGVDIDKNVITRIETDKRYVADFEIKAIAQIFDVSYEYLLDN